MSVVEITKLPDFLVKCGLCNGKGHYEQTYCDGPNGSFRTSGPCSMCELKLGILPGPGFVYTNGTRVTESIIAQVLTLNGIDLSPRDWILQRPYF